MHLPDIAIGAVIAAAITGVIALLGLTISKESKVSEFRQAWIDALRSDIASLVTSVHAIHDAVQATDLGVSFSGGGGAGAPVVVRDHLEIWKAVRDDWNTANRTVTAIRLRVNPVESEDLLILLTKFEDEIQPGKPVSKENLTALEKELVSVAQKLLKREWTVVRDGEPVYRLTKWITLGAVSISLFVLAVLVVYKT